MEGNLDDITQRPPSVPVDAVGLFDPYYVDVTTPGEYFEGSVSTGPKEGPSDFYVQKRSTSKQRLRQVAF